MDLQQDHFQRFRLQVFYIFGVLEGGKAEGADKASGGNLLFGDDHIADLFGMALAVDGGFDELGEDAVPMLCVHLF